MNRTPLVLIVMMAAACRRDPPARRAAPPSAPSAGASPTARAPSGAPPAASVDPPAGPEAFRETSRFLPQGVAVPGWTQSGAVRLASASELFQIMDGAAEKYVGYGVRQFARTEYRKTGSQLVVSAEVYDMGSVLGAFGQYSMLLSDSRDPASMQANAVAQGGGGFLGTSQLVFWRGQYLVQLNLADESEEPDESALAGSARDVLPALAARVAAAIPGETTAPTEARILPTEGLVWGGATYLANNVLAVDQTGPGWVGHYAAAGGQRYRVAVLSRGSAEAARAALQRFRGAGLTAVSGVGDEAFTTATFAAARKGSTVVVVAGPAPAELPTLPAGDRSGRLRAVVAALP
ncbi:MAG: hypothetical protein Q8S73_42075 [Deltaproteobacteria bacterium]|nr:hypothetical protein [Myxococcales bacterium]MDP3220750.1 hypothetical protein [Deltaproteobacteria bacterium]